MIWIQNSFTRALTLAMPAGLPVEDSAPRLTVTNDELRISWPTVRARTGFSFPVPQAARDSSHRRTREIPPSYTA